MSYIGRLNSLYYYYLTSEIILMIYVSQTICDKVYSQKRNSSLQILS